jgi:signal transduction histidine kinase
VVTLAIIAASLLVLYLQHKAVAELDREAMAVAETVARQRVRSVAEGLRRSFDGAVLDTLFSASTEPGSQRRLSAIARRFEAGHQSYPYVSRFFLWDEHTQAAAPGRVLFFQRAGEHGATILPAGDGTGFYEIPAASARLAEVCRQFGRGDSRVTYAVVEEVLEGVPSQVVIRWSWLDENFRETFVVSGFVVDMSAVRTRLFSALFARQLQPLLVEEGLTPQSLYVRDELGQVIFGGAQAPAAPVEMPISMIFFPVTARLTRLVARPPSKTWVVGVASVDGAERIASMSPLAKGYWLSGGAIVLMLLALALAIRANRQAERLSVLRANLVSSVTHQLRTPLSLINLAGETMALGRIDSADQMREYLGVVRRETAQLVRLVEKTLEISRLEDSSRVYRFDTVDVAELVNGSVARFRDRLADRELSIRVQVGERPVLAQLDAGAMEQALINLLDNAVRYSNGMKQIDVRVGDRQRQVKIEVADYGVGISGEDLPHIFDKFYRGSNNRSVRSGFGLGLAIVYEIVQAHHGRVEVRSTPNQGTTFSVFVRRVEREPVRA